MKKMIIITGFIILTGICFCQIFELTNNAKLNFPDDVYLQDNKSGFKFMIGLQPEFIKDNYGDEVTETIVNNISQTFKVFQINFRNINLQYNTIDNIITSVEMVTSSAKTSRGIGIGSTKEDVVEKYQYPDNIISKNESTIYLYEAFFPELNSEAEYTRIRFLLKNNVVVKIDISIISSI